MSFRVGQKVVCIDGRRTPGCLDPTPEKGEVCTVASVYYEHDGTPWTLELIEYPSPETVRWSPGWDIRAFRPVQTTDISIFKAMLSPAPEKEMV